MIDSSYLPAADETVRCATHSRRLGLDPGGTAFWVDEIIVADVPLPWPKPVWQKPGFDHIPYLVSEAGKRGRRVRVLAAVPETTDPSMSEVSIHRRLPGTAGFMTDRHSVMGDSVGNFIGHLLSSDPDDSPSTEAGQAAPGGELLVCTQGSHDICCGTHGTTFAAAIRSAEPSLTVRRVSHTGGHRFAPTALSLPDGRMWGLIEADTMLGILHHMLSPAVVAPYCRGFTGAAPGPAQMAERAVMALVDHWSFDSEPRTVEVDHRSESSLICLVTTAESSWQVVIAPGREIPVIACGAAGGLPAKPGREWLVESIVRIG